LGIVERAELVMAMGALESEERGVMLPRIEVPLCELSDGQVVGLGTLEELQRNEHPFVQQFFARQPDPEGETSEDYLRSLTGNQ